MDSKQRQSTFTRSRAGLAVDTEPKHQGVSPPAVQTSAVLLSQTLHDKWGVDEVRKQ